LEEEVQCSKSLLQQETSKMAGTDDNQDRKGLYAVDIRVFLVTITIVMAVSFVVGVSIAPEPTSVHSIKGNTILSSPSTPEVHDSFFNLSEKETNTAEDLHLPAGQHLLVDIEGVDGEFLNSEERLSKAMVDTVNEAGLHMLSYHCHALLPAGVSCVGVLLESHISFHTWPSDGVITLDLFTCGSNPLLPVVATIERLFGIPSEKNPDQKIHTQWSHELRGFRPEEEIKKNYLADSSDLSLWVLSPLEMYSKTQVYSGRTKFQQVDVWDLVGKLLFFRRVSASNF
jgi:S-adenosylmethionine decarboxylase proenzyme